MRQDEALLVRIGLELTQKFSLLYLNYFMYQSTIHILLFGAKILREI